jgi:hypothetical protein
MRIAASGGYARCGEVRDDWLVIVHVQLLSPLSLGHPG